MRIDEVTPTLIKLHYFRVDDTRLAVKLGMKQDRSGAWYLPEYNTSGSRFDQMASEAIRAFGPPRTSDLRNR